MSTFQSKKRGNDDLDEANLGDDISALIVNIEKSEIMNKKDVILESMIKKKKKRGW